MAKPALGRGLGALLGGSPPTAAPPVSQSTPPPPALLAGSPESLKSVRLIPRNRIRPCSFQPRKEFTVAAIQELADSIKEQGIIQPLIVRPAGEDYELIAGERRWRAAELAGLAELPVIVREADDRTVLELALIENLQRENLNPIEEAHGFAQLIGQFQITQEEAAAKVGKSRAAVANALRLLNLAEEVQAYVRDGHLSVGHAKVILGLIDHEQQMLAARRVIKEALSVRQTEELISQIQAHAATVTTGKSARSRALPVRDTHVVDLESRLQERLGTKVSLRYRQGKGAVEIRFFNDADLERILQIVGINLD